MFDIFQHLFFFKSWTWTLFITSTTTTLVQTKNSLLDYCSSFLLGLLGLLLPSAKSILNTPAILNLSECQWDHNAPPMGSLLKVKHQSLFRGLQGFTQSGYLLSFTLLTAPQPQTHLTSHRVFAIAPPLLNGCSSPPSGLSSNATFSGMTSQQLLNAHTHAHFWYFFQVNFLP